MIIETDRTKFNRGCHGLVKGWLIGKIYKKLIITSMLAKELYKKI